MTRSVAPTPWIEPAELARDTAAPVVLDVRWTLASGAQPEAYAAGHVPGARFVDLDADLAGPPGAGGRHPLPAVAVFEAAMRRCGVTPGRPVVAYDDFGGAPAARAWWLLRWCGHERARVLRGGWTGWVASGLPVDTEVPAPASGDFTARPGAMPLVDVEGAARLARDGLLLDARAPERFRGEVEPVDAVAGHIPGARSSPPGTPAEVPPGMEVGAYCGSGVTAALRVLELEDQGVRAALFAGSWSEWISDPTRPVARGG